MIVDASPTFLQVDRVRVVQMHEHLVFASIPTAMLHSSVREGVRERVHEQRSLTERSANS